MRGRGRRLFAGQGLLDCASGEPKPRLLHLPTELRCTVMKFDYQYWSNLPILELKNPQTIDIGKIFQALNLTIGGFGKYWQ